MGIRIEVDRDLCQGHGVCESEAPDLFEVGRDRQVVVADHDDLDSVSDELALAVKYCPTHALSIIED